MLVIEYGYIDNSSHTLTPYLATVLNTADMFSDVISTPQPALGNQTFDVLIGAVVGGGTIVNGMEYDRGAPADYDAWESLGNPGWGWSDLVPYFKKVCITLYDVGNQSMTFFKTEYDFHSSFECNFRGGKWYNLECLSVWKWASAGKHLNIPISGTS